MDERNCPFNWIDCLLLLAIAGLSALLLMMLLGPAIEAWRNRPRPGVQVPQQYLVKQGSVADAATIPINYLLYLPPEYTRYKKWPLVVFLHGSGERGNDLGIVGRVGLPRLVAQGQHFNFILLSPQCPAYSGWSPELVVALIEHVSCSLPVDRDRVYLTGFSMGGVGVWATAIYNPGRFAALAPLCGGGDVGQAKRLKDIPIWAFHGDEDDVVPLAASEMMVDAVRKCGGHVEFTIYPGADHDIWDATYQNKQFCTWLLDQRRKQHSK